MTRTTANVLFYLCSTAAVVSSFSPSSSFSVRSFTTEKRPNASTRLAMALTPVGPFCPFRSSMALEEASVVSALTRRGSAAGSRPSRPATFVLPVQDDDLALEFNRLRAELSCGLSPDPWQMHDVADRVDVAVREWETIVEAFQQSPDFATLEHVQLSHQLEHYSDNMVTTEAMASMMKWQASCLRSMADGIALPPMPPNVNAAHMLQELQRRDTNDNMDDSNQDVSLTVSPLVALARAAHCVTASPFGRRAQAAFESSMVTQEYNALCEDHMNLIELGGQYEGFCSASKLVYLDKSDAIAERWDVFFARFALMGALNPKYLEQCDQFLAMLGVTETEYRQLLRQTHQQMRLQAVKEEMFGQP